MNNLTHTINTSGTYQNVHHQNPHVSYRRVVYRTPQYFTAEEYYHMQQAKLKAEYEDQQAKLKAIYEEQQKKKLESEVQQNREVSIQLYPEDALPNEEDLQENIEIIQRAAAIPVVSEVSVVDDPPVPDLNSSKYTINSRNYIPSQTYGPYPTIGHSSAISCPSMTQTIPHRNAYYGHIYPVYPNIPCTTYPYPAAQYGPYYSQHQQSHQQSYLYPAGTYNIYGEAANTVNKSEQNKVLPDVTPATTTSSNKYEVVEVDKEEENLEVQACEREDYDVVKA